MYKKPICHEVATAFIGCYPEQESFRIANSSIKEAIDLSRQSNQQIYFPDYTNSKMMTVKDGLAFSHCALHNGHFSLEILKNDGMVVSLRRVDGNASDDQDVRIQLSRLEALIRQILLFSSSYYDKLGYSGKLILFVELRNCEGLSLVYPHSWHQYGQTCLLGKYFWEFDLNTDTLNSDDHFNQSFAELLGKMYWDLGFGNDTNPHNILERLKQSGMIKKSK